MFCSIFSGIDENPMTSTYEKKLKALRRKVEKEKLKAVVPVLDLKNARNPSLKAAYEIAHDYHQTIGQFKGMNNLVTVTYQKPKVTNTFQHKPDPNRVVLKETSKPKPNPVPIGK